MEQYNTFMSILPEVETALAAKGVDITRPDFGGGSVAKGDHAEGGEEEEKSGKEKEDSDG